MSPRFRGQTNYPVEHAFTLGGRHYFTWVNHANMPVRRMESAKAIYAEYDMRITMSELRVMAEVGLVACNKGKPVEAGAIFQELLNRMDNNADGDIIMRLASVLYFDQDENTDIYDGAYAEQKVARWIQAMKQEKGGELVLENFTRRALPDLLPQFGLSPLDLDTYSKLIRTQRLQHLKFLSKVLGSDATNKQLTSSIDSETARLTQLIH